VTVQAWPPVDVQAMGIGAPRGGGSIR